MEKEKNDLLNDNISRNNNEINDFDYIYEMLFGIVSNIISDQTKLDIKLKQFNILEKLLSNIIIAEKSKKNSGQTRLI